MEVSLSWMEINMIFMIKEQQTVLAIQMKYPGPASQYRVKVSIIFTEYVNLCPRIVNNRNEPKQSTTKYKHAVANYGGVKLLEK